MSRDYVPRTMPPQPIVDRSAEESYFGVEVVATHERGDCDAACPICRDEADAEQEAQMDDEKYDEQN